VNRACLPAVNNDVEQAALDAAEDIAVQVLFNLSGRQFGECPVIARPCVQACSRSGIDLAGPGWFPLYFYLDGSWRNTSCSCSGACTRSGPSVVHLSGPVRSIVAVTVGGELLDPSQYKLEGDLLIRVGGVAWPDQDLLRPLDEAGTWSVEYLRGSPVPAGVGVLVGKLALEFYNACSGGKCKLPRRVTSVSRQNVTYQMVDPTDIYAEGKTGIPEIDLWLAAVNPKKIQRRSRVR
jgi:hypothetical protein